MPQTIQTQPEQENQPFDIRAFFGKAPALDKGYVELIDGMVSDPLLKIVNAARVSFNKQSDVLSEKDERLIKFLYEHKHYSTFRHSYFTFRMKAPLFVFRQLWKHQIGVDWTEDESFAGVGDISLPSTSWNEASGRYVEFEPEFYIPDVIRFQSKDNKQGSEGDANHVVTDFSPFGWPVRDYFEEVCMQSYEAYKKMVGLGLAKEQMRLLLPQNIYSECILTLSLQALLYLWEMRDKKDAQWESRQYAIASKELILPVFRGKLHIV